MSLNAQDYEPTMYPIDMDSVRFWSALPHPDPYEVLAEGERIDFTPLTLGRGELYFPDRYTWARSLDIDGNLAALAFECWVIMANIQNLTSPTPICYYERPYPEDGCNDVKIHGNYLFVTNRVTGLEVYYYNATGTPPSLNLIYTYHQPPDMQYRYIEISGDRAFISCKTGLVVLNIQNPTSIPEPIVVLYNPDPRPEACYNKDLAVDAKYVFQACANQGIQVYDFTDFDAGTGPVKRYQILYCPPNSWRNAQDVWVDGDFLYVADLYHGLEVFDITHPEDCVPYCAPTRVGEMPWIGHGKVKYYATAISGSGDWVYVSSRYFDPNNNPDPCYGYLTVFNCTNPTGEIPFWSMAYDSKGVDQSCVHGNWVIYASGTAGRARSHMACQQVAERIVSPLRYGYLAGLNLPSNFAIAGNYAYVTTFHTLSVIDISDPAGPSLVASFLRGHKNTGVAIAGNYLYFNSYDSLYVVRITNPTAIDPHTDFRSFPVVNGENIGEIALYGNYLFTFGHIGSTLAVLRVWEITDAFSPEFVTDLVFITGLPPGTTTMENVAGQIEVAGDTAYVSLAWNPYTMMSKIEEKEETPEDLHTFDSWFSLFVVDISNPTTPVLVGSFGFPDWLKASSISLDGDYLFSLCDNEQKYDLSSWNITNPASPVLAGYCDFLDHPLHPQPGWINRFGDDCYFSNRKAGGGTELYLYYADITNPSSFSVSTLLSYTSSSYYTWGEVRGDHLFVVGVHDGSPWLDIYKVSNHPTSLLRKHKPTDRNVPQTLKIETFPNPFNALTNIVIELPTGAKTEVLVYDVLGRVVKSLFLGQLESGKHSFSWDGKNSLNKESASGLYYMVVKANKLIAISKVILTR